MIFLIDKGVIQFMFSKGGVILKLLENPAVRISLAKNSEWSLKPSKCLKLERCLRYEDFRLLGINFQQ